MKSTNFLFLMTLGIVLILNACKGNGKSGESSNSNLTKINPSEMKQIGNVNERFQSYNVEMVEVVGGKFWKPYKLMDSLPSGQATSTYDISQNNDQMYRQLAPINLTDKRLLNLAKGLAPAYVRVSGTWANAIYFQNDDNPKVEKAPAGFVNVLTRKEWKGVLDFIKATGSKLVTSFAVSNGVRDGQGVWTPKEAQKIADYTKSMGGSIAAAELFNEPTMPLAGGAMNKNYSAHNFAMDVAVFKSWVKKEVPDMLIAGPGSVGEGLNGVNFADLRVQFMSSDAMMSADPKPVFDVFSYHFYGAASIRMVQSGRFSIKPDNALTDAWLRRTDTVAVYYTGLRDKYNPGKSLWITETGEAAAGGDPFAATYLDCFRYLYQLGSLAQKNIQVIMHNTLAASEYSLIDQDTHLPKPNYWAALLWAKLMGTKVYDAGKGDPGVYLFAHDTKGVKNGITLMVLNTNKTPGKINIADKGQQYTLTAKELQASKVQFNGKDLQLTANDELPSIEGQSVDAGDVTLKPLSINFFTFSQK